MQFDLSIVIPCYNAEKHIVNTIKEIDSFLHTTGLRYEIIPVNDGSKDSTESLIEKLASNPDNSIYGIINKVSYTPNMGKGEAIRRGILEASGDYIIFIDADLPVDVSYILKMLDKLKEKDADFVFANRRSVGASENASLFRHLVSMTGFLITKVILGIPYKDTQAGFKGFNSRCAKALASAQKVKRFAFDIEYLYVSHLYGFKISSIPVVYENDVENSTVHIFRDSIKTLADVFYIRSRRRDYLSHRSSR